MRKKLFVILLILALIILALHGFSQCRTLSYGFRETHHENFYVRNADSAQVYIDDDNGTITIMEWTLRRFNAVQFHVIARTLSTQDAAEWIVQTQDPTDTQPNLYACLYLDIKDHYTLTYMRGSVTLVFDNDYLKSIKPR